MSKSLFFTIITALVITFVGAGVWFFFFYRAPDREVSLNAATDQVRNFLPFGSPDKSTQNVTPAEKEALAENKNVRTFGALTRLVAAPVAGYLPLKATTTAVRYLERATGHISDILLNEGKTLRITNTTIPRVYEAFFADSGASVIIRYLRDDNATIETYHGSIPKLGQNEVGELKGVFLPVSIQDITTSSDGKKIFYLTSFGGGSSGFTSSPSNTARAQVFSSLLTEWLSSWPRERTVLMTTKPSGGVGGFAYTFDPINKTMERLMGNIPGLTTLMSPDGKWVFYGTAGAVGLSSGVYDVVAKEFFPLGIATIADKCAWNKDNTLFCGVPSSAPARTYPDAWYQGSVLFTDRIWSVDPSTQGETLIYDIRSKTGLTLDAIRLSFASDSKTLFFINKKDQSLWSLNISK